MTKSAKPTGRNRAPARTSKTIAAKTSSSSRRSNKPVGAKSHGPQDLRSAVPRESTLLDRQEMQMGFSVVAIGASAGGLDAIQQFFDHVPTDMGVAFVVVQHHAPDYNDGMVPLLKRHTAMPVVHIENGVALAPNTVYLAPAGLYLSIVGGCFHCIKPEPAGRLRMPIDFFFRALAQSCGERAVGVVLSGTGTDGTLGVRAIKNGGGMTLAQDTGSAAYDGMPQFAIASGNVDYVSPPHEMAQKIARFIEHPYAASTGAALAPESRQNLEAIFLLLRTHTGHDFTHYKRNTIIRRIERRMAVNQLVNISDYVRYLQNTKHEVTALLKEFLISVTGFFRDAEAFAVVVAKALPNLLVGRGKDQPLRIWVPGSATAEEAYSLAILLQEELHRRGEDIKVQIFATDIDVEALDFARAGVYPESISTDVAPARLQQFFTHEGHVYRVKKPIREMVIFAQQNIIQDPPFSRLDLIACRNLLIYFDRVLQQRIFPLFHYTLNPRGYLLLGLSESVSEFSDLFMPVDKKWKLYQRKGARRNAPSFQAGTVLNPPIETPKHAALAGKEPTVAEMTEKYLLAEHTPACVVVDAKYNIVHLQGPIGEFLELPSGTATFNVLKMIRPELRIDLRSALHVASKKREKVVRSGVLTKKSGRTRAIDLVVRPLVDTHLDPDLMMVIFASAAPTDPQPAPKANKKTRSQQPLIDQRILDLEDELGTAKESLLITIREVETTNEELKSANEELQSTNEELQSTNEELETSKEELQSINEEVVTVNSELQTKVDELSQATNDMVNMLSSTRIGTVLIDNHLNIKRFTPVAGETMNLIPTDVGRPLRHIVPNLTYEGLATDVATVLKTLKAKQQEVQTRDGIRYLMRMLPYRTMENIIDGVIISFIDVSDLTPTKRPRGAPLTHVAGLIEAMSGPALVLNPRDEVVLANTAYYRLFRMQPAETVGRSIFALGRFDDDALRALLERARSAEALLEKFAVPSEFGEPATRAVAINAYRIELTPASGDVQESILLTFDVAHAGASDVA